MDQRKICKRCLYGSDHPLGLTFDDEGICSGCRVHEEKDTLDWRTRWENLKALVAPYRIPSGRTYDCIVPVTGGGDSYFIVHLVKHHLGLNPLLVTYNKYYNTPLGIRNLANLRIKFNCDLLMQNINPQSVRKVTRTTLRELGSIYWHCHAGQTAFPVQTAVKHKIPLIIWGAHQGIEQVGMFSHQHEVEMSRRYRKDHDLMGYEADDLLSTFDTLSEDDIWQYRYPSDFDIRSADVVGIYLGNFVRWDPKKQHEMMVSQYNYRSARFARTFDSYDHVDCFNYMGVHDLLKLYKHGYSKVTDHASREIRHGRLTRSDALALVRHHETGIAQHSELFSEWLGAVPQSIQFIMNSHRNPRYWIEEKPGRWVFAGCSSLEPGPTEVISQKFLDAYTFAATSELADGMQAKYIVVGKGFP